jgi:S-formylglutathione hydrolase FrmB
MRKSTIVTILAVLALSGAAMAQAGNTASGTLTVTATVNSSINLVFNSDAAGVPLSSGAGTNAATLAFGNVAAFGAIGANITRTVVAGTSFTVSTPVDVLVTKANSSSANYTLKAQLGAADATNTWAVAGNTITSAAASTITATGTYGSNASESIAITIPFTEASGTAISNTINFTATSN